MAQPEALISLDTAAFGRARRSRLSRRLAYWLILAAAAAAITALLALAAARLEPTPARPGATGAAPAAAAVRTAAVPPRSAIPAVPAVGVAPPPGATPVTVWNGYGGQGAASQAAARLKGLGYPLAAVGNAKRPVFNHTLLLYVPGARAAAVTLARRLGLPRTSVAPLDGVRPKDVKPARLVLVLGG